MWVRFYGPVRDLHDTRSLKIKPSRKRRCWFGIIGLFGAMLCLLPFGADGQAADIFRVGFTYKVFGEVNENDAMAAVRAWAQAFVKERDISADFGTVGFKSLSETEAALSGGTVEAVNMTVMEFEQLRHLVADDAVICGVISDSISEEYVLLVNRKSNIKALSNLKGRSLGLLSSVRASMAATWLDTLLLRKGMGTVTGFFGQVDTNPKVDKLVISLFFGKLDACVATRRGFDLMVELNPQTGKQLSVISSSAPIVPTVFCFRKGYASPIRNQILAEMQRLHLSPAGKQSLTIFQTDSLEEQPTSCLDGAIKMISEHRELLGDDGAELSGNRKISPSGKKSR